MFSSTPQRCKLKSSQFLPPKKFAILSVYKGEYPNTIIEQGYSYSPWIMISNTMYSTCAMKLTSENNIGLFKVTYQS